MPVYVPLYVTHACTRTDAQWTSESGQRASARLENHGGFRKRGYSGDWKHRSDSFRVGKQLKEHGKVHSWMFLCGVADNVLFCRCRERVISVLLCSWMAMSISLKYQQVLRRHYMNYIHVDVFYYSVYELKEWGIIKNAHIKPHK